MSIIRKYIKHGITGYGPDLEPDDTPHEGWQHVCRAIRWELEADADMLEDGAHSLAEAGDYEAAWKDHIRADKLHILAMNLDYDRRKTAPLYRDDVPALEATMERLVTENFPLEISTSPATTLYVWDAPPGHEWQKGWLTGTVTCSRCHLLPLDDDDMNSPCEGGE